MDKTDVLMELSAAGRDDLCEWANSNLHERAAVAAEAVPVAWADCYGSAISDREKTRRLHSSVTSAFDFKQAQTFDRPLYAAPQPGPDVAPLVKALHHIVDATEFHCTGSAAACEKIARDALAAYEKGKK